MEQPQIDMSRIVDELLTLLVDPASNLIAALVLYGIITVLLLLVVVATMMFLVSGSDEDEEGEGPYGQFDEDDFEHFDDEEPAPAAAVVAPAPVQPVRPKVPLNPAVALAWAAGIIVSLWLVTGVSTATDALCTSCHVDTPHAEAAGAEDPHASTGCVSCHEPGGVFGRYVGSVPARVTHVASGVLGGAGMDDYGRVTQSACSSCHRGDIRQTRSNEERGLRVSHVEPVAAGMRCVECHRLETGIVAEHNAGMNACLRCHNAQTASADCETCHDKSAATAARARAVPAASPQIEEVRCGGCHDEVRECDGCHGTRMPHSVQFKQYAHARAGAVDIWFNNGQGCAKCHTAQRRPCQGCHTSLMGKGHGPVMAAGHKSASEQSCNTCHISMAYQPRRSFCVDLCHTEAARAESPR